MLNEVVDHLVSVSVLVWSVLITSRSNACSQSHMNDKTFFFVPDPMQKKYFFIQLDM